MSGELTPERVARLLAGPLGSPYLYRESCSSTQDLVRDPALPEGAVAVAEHQTAGRGRSGRAWQDAAGEALLCSVLLRPPVTPDLPQLSLVAALAAAEAVERVSPVVAAVKWPNDVLVEGRKVAGILLEGIPAGLVCGIGVNVGQGAAALPADGPVPAGSLRLATGERPDRGLLLAALLERLGARYAAWREGGLAPLLPELERRSWLAGRRVSTPEGRGTAAALAADGRLTVALDAGGTALVVSGEVTVLR